MDKQKMRRGLSSALSGIMTLPLVLAVLLGCVYFFATFQPFYEFEYDRLGIHESTGMSEEALSSVTAELIKYIEGKPSNMYIQAEVRGEMRQIFNQKEIDHMVDVQVLFNLAKTAMLISGGAIAVFAALALLAVPKGQRRYSFWKGVLCALMLLILLILAIGLYVAIDFNTAFTQFHHIFFADDAEMKWILDPSTDILIQMVPTQYFIDIALAIFASFLVIIAALITTAQRNFVRGRQAITSAAVPKQAGGDADNRPSADEIFSTMGISDDSAVPQSVIELIEKKQDGGITPAANETAPASVKEEKASADDILKRLEKL